MLQRIFMSCFFVFAGFYSLQLFAQQNDYPSKRIYLGIEPILLVTGELGGYADLALGEKQILHGYFAWNHWYWSNSDEIEQWNNEWFSNYVLAGKGPVARLGMSFTLSQNPFAFSYICLKPEFTWKHLTYDHVCFVDGSKGMSSSGRQLCSMDTDYYAFHLIFTHRHFQSSFETFPVDWFIGPGLGIGVEKYTIHGKINAGSCQDEGLNAKTNSTEFYYSLRFGFRFGFRVFQSKM